MNLHSFHPLIYTLSGLMASIRQRDVNGVFESILGYRAMSSWQIRHALVAMECTDVEANELLTSICSDDAILNDIPALCYLLRTDIAELMKCVTRCIRTKHRKQQRSLFASKQRPPKSPEELIEKSQLYLRQGVMTTKQLLDDIEVKRLSMSGGSSVFKLLMVDDVGAVLGRGDKTELTVTEFLQKLQAIVSQHHMLAFLLCKPGALSRLSSAPPMTLYSYRGDGTAQAFKASILSPNNVLRPRKMGNPCYFLAVIELILIFIT